MNLIPSLKITYWAEMEPNGIIEFDGINEFRKAIATEYAGIVKVMPGELGGGLYEFIIEFIFNGTLADYIKVIGGYIGGKSLEKMTDPYLERYVFKPLQRAYKKLKERNPQSLETYSFTIELSDTRIIIYKAGTTDIISYLNNVLQEIGNRFKHLWWEDNFPYEIHVPALKDKSKDTVFFRPPLGEDEYISVKEYDYHTGYWGVLYFKNGLCCAYNLSSGMVEPDSKFVTEETMNSKMD